MVEDKNGNGEGTKEPEIAPGISDDELEQINIEHFKAYQLVVQRIIDYLCQSEADGKPQGKKDIKPLDLLRLSSSLSIVQKGQRLAKQMDKARGQAQTQWFRVLRERALEDVAFQRTALYNLPLFPPQLEAIRLIEEHIHNKSGQVITVRSARQTMKNECSAMLCVRALEYYRDIGGTYIRTAPTWRPQMINSKQRVEKFLKLDPLINQDYQRREGFILQHGKAQVLFLSSDKRANVVGSTASIALDIDEAHKVDRGKFEEDFGPMAAYHNVPIIMWGVAADKQDLLYEYVQHNLEHHPELNLSYPASVWCELLPQYAKHYEERVRKLGADHPVILTQYDLVDVDTLGGYLKPHHISGLLDSDHQRCAAPRDGASYIITIDIAGEAEVEEDDPLKKSRGARDSTVALIFEVDLTDRRNDYPACRLVDMYWWTGKPLGDGSSGLPGQQSSLLRLLKLWKPRATVVDARGVGEQIAKYLSKHQPGVTAYAADGASVSQDCYGLLALLNNERVKVFRNDDSPEYAELCRQLKTCRYEIREHDHLRLVKPKPSAHIDMVKALTYLYRALLQFVPAAISGLEPPKGWYRSRRKRVWE
jgi:hypothetical protein